MNRSDRMHRLAFYDALATSAKKKAGELREALDAEARAELKRTGTAQTWRVPELGTLSQPIAHDRFVVDQPPLFTAWVAEHYPTEVETVTQVRPAFAGVLLSRAALDEGEVVEAREDGNRPLPGVRFVPGGEPKPVSLTVAKAAKEGLRVLADDAISGLYAANFEEEGAGDEEE